MFCKCLRCNVCNFDFILIIFRLFLVLQLKYIECFSGFVLFGYKNLKMVCLNCFKYKLGKRKIEFMYYNFEYVKIFIIIDFFIKDK